MDGSGFLPSLCRMPRALACSDGYSALPGGASTRLSRPCSPYALLFLGAQFFAVAITIFGFAAYAWLPLFGRDSVVGLVA